MKVIIEIEKDEDIKKIEKALKGASITVIKTQQKRRKILDAIFKKYNVKLPADYKFDREEIHVR